MPRSCVVRDCKSLATKTSRANGLTFHALPTNPVYKKMWLDNIRRVNKDGTPWVPYYQAAVCSKHFKKCCFTGPVEGVSETLNEKPLNRNPKNQRGQGRKTFFEEDPIGIDSQAVSKKKGNQVELETDAKDEINLNYKYAKPRKRKTLFSTAVPTLAMGIPSDQLAHIEALPEIKVSVVVY